MNTEDLLRERRSVRKYKREIVSKDIIYEILDLTRYAPSWKNYQIARFNIVNNQDIITKLGEKAVKGFSYNVATLKNASNVMVLSYIKGRSGTMGKEGYITSKTDTWEVFDAGIAAHQFCLAAHSKGVGSVIMGVIDEDIIRNLIDLPQEEAVGALIVYGYEDGEHALAPQRKNVEELVRFI
jgi:nitroreductase